MYGREDMDEMMEMYGGMNDGDGDGVDSGSFGSESTFHDGDNPPENPKSNSKAGSQIEF